MRKLGQIRENTFCMFLGKMHRYIHISTLQCNACIPLGYQELEDSLLLCNISSLRASLAKKEHGCTLQSLLCSNTQHCILLALTKIGWNSSKRIEGKKRLPVSGENSENSIHFSTVISFVFYLMWRAGNSPQIVLMMKWEIPVVI